MSEKRMLIVDAEVARKVDENRGEMSRSEFINFLMDSQLREEKEDIGKPNYVTREEFSHSQQGMKELLRSFLEFFISYGLEVGKQPRDKTFEELSQRLQALSDSSSKAKNP
ncbi:MAG: hypothetical protein OEW82_02965 [Dehalococcoidia bacterium]|nr:hypothetical protein [Dehalococcoidia bacterium]